MAGEFGDLIGLDFLGGGSSVPDFPTGGLGAAGSFDVPGLSLPGGPLTGGETTGPGWDRFFAGGVPGVGAGAAPGGGSSNWFNSIFGNQATPLSALAQSLGLGASGVGIANTIGAMNRANAQQKVQTTGQNLATSAAQPAIGYGTQLVQDAQQGKLSAPMEASIAQWTQQAKADMRAKLSHLGLGDSTSIQQYENQIDQMAQAMKANLLLQMGSQGVAALGTGANVGLGLAQSGGQNDALLNDLIAQANRTLGLLGARGGALAA